MTCCLITFAFFYTENDAITTKISDNEIGIENKNFLANKIPGTFSSAIPWTNAPMPI